VSAAATDRRRLFVSSAIGGAAALLVLFVVVAHGHADWFVREPFGNFYDAQARALLDGHWDVPASEMFIEGFSRNGKTYQYFGVWPALLRMPVLAVSDGPYGRLTQVSLLLAAAVALTGFTALHWRIRELVRPDRAVSRGEAVIVALATFAFGCGTTLVFLTGRAWVYHEAILWGVAWTILAFERVIAYSVEPSGRRLAAASAFTALAFASRASLALGPTVALGLVLLLQLLAWWRERGREGAAAGHLRRIGALVLAIVVPIVSYAVVNQIRFGNPVSVPWTKQLLMNVDARHRAVLAANDGSYFGMKFAPTTLLQYLRPDALAPSGLFPWLSFPRFRTPVIGDALFDTLDPSSSIPASMPAVTLLAIVAVLALIVRPRFTVPGALAALRIALVGAVVGCALVIGISYVAQRYLGDFLPLLALAALLGLQILLFRLEEERTRRLARGLLVVTAVLAVFGVWANLSLTVLYQRLYNPTEPAMRQAMLSFQYDVDRRTPGHPHRLLRADRLPRAVAEADTTVIVGDCAAVYWSDGRSWIPVEGTPAGGWYRFTVAPDAADASPAAILSWTDRKLTVRRAGDRVHVALDENGQMVAQGSAVVGSGRFPLEVRADRYRDHLQVGTDGLVIMDVPDVELPAAPPEVGEPPGIRELPPHLLVCPAIDSRWDARGGQVARQRPNVVR
jgi:hypothetical protein